MSTHHKSTSVTAQKPCPVCKATKRCLLTSDGDWCICYREASGAINTKTDKDGVQYWTHRLTPWPTTHCSHRGATLAPPEQRHRVYEAFLDCLGLEARHLAALRKRGFQRHDAIPGILRRSYATLGKNRTAACQALVERGLESLLPGVPGFVVKEGLRGGSYWTLAGWGGLAIAVRDVHGQIVSLRVRKEEEQLQRERRENPSGQDSGKYVWVSSGRNNNGVCAQPHVHVPSGFNGCTEVVRITEGEIKSHLATLHSGVLTISIPGVSIWRQAGLFESLQTLRCKIVRLAFDMDQESNPQVALQLHLLAAELRTRGYEIEVERWDPSFKGIDDLLVAGKTPEVTQGEQAEQRIASVVASSGAKLPLPEENPGRPLAPPGPARLFSTDQEEAADDPHRLARQFLRETSQGGANTLGYWNEEWMSYRDNVWDAVAESTVRIRLTRSIKAWFDQVVLQQRQRWEERGRRDAEGNPCDPPVALKVTSGRRNDAVGALCSLAEVTADPPAWLGMPPPFDPQQAIVFTNGILSMADWMEGRTNLHPLTPRFWTRTACDYPFEPSAPEPKQWHGFLRQTWGDDEESIQLLQEWAGYLLLPDNQHQKALMMIGPTRAGKGVILGVLKGLIGERSSASSSLDGLAGPFGLANLPGRTSCLIEDARLSNQADISVVKSRLLTIIGGGGIDINRKNQRILHLVLPVRFTIATNEVPAILDASGAIAGRFLLLKFVHSRLGQEDPNLLKRLCTELPGIAVWALQGLRRLRKRGRFVVPQSSADLVQQFQDLASPIRVFVEECCVLSEGAAVAKRGLYERYTEWCQLNGKRAKEDGIFYRDLYSAFPNIRETKPRKGDVRQKLLQGIMVAPADCNSTPIASSPLVGNNDAAQTSLEESRSEAASEAGLEDSRGSTEGEEIETGEIE